MRRLRHGRAAWARGKGLLQLEETPYAVFKESLQSPVVNGVSMQPAVWQHLGFTPPGREFQSARLKRPRYFKIKRFQHDVGVVRTRQSQITMKKIPLVGGVIGILLGGLWIGLNPVMSAL